MTKCKDCGKEVSKSAKVCPNCGAKLKMALWLKALIVFIALGFIGAITSKDKPEAKKVATEVASSATAKSDAATPAPEPAKPAGPQVGVPFRSGDVEVTVTGVEQKSQVGNPMFASRPAEGGVYVVVRWKYKNIGSTPIGLFSKPNVNLLDPKDVKYDVDIGASSSYATEANLTSKVLSDLNPGITASEAEVFEVAKGAFDKNTWRVLVSADDDFKVSLK